MNNKLQHSHEVIKIIENHKLHNYIHGLLDHWIKKPPTAGHGFYHALEVASNSYKLAELNKIEPIKSFLSGLYHDIYRPTKGEEGDEDQREGADFVQNIFLDFNLDKEYLPAILHTIRTHDDWIKDKKPPLIPLLVSFADKMSHDYIIVYMYAWSSNIYLEKRKKDKKYQSHLDVISDFTQYQTRAWELFRNHNNKIIEGNLAIKAYIEIFKQLIKNYELKSDQKQFEKYLNKIMNKSKQKEQMYLKKFVDKKSKIESIMINYNSI